MISTDYILIGGGIIGMTTARELARQGAHVCLFERAQLGMGTSWAAGGIISPMRPWAESKESVLLSETSKRLYPKFVNQLKNETGIDPDYIKSGLIIIDPEHAIRTKNWATNNAVNFRDNFEKKNNSLKIPDDSILLPDIAQVCPPNLLKALKKA